VFDLQAGGIATAMDMTGEDQDHQPMTQDPSILSQSTQEESQANKGAADEPVEAMNADDEANPEHKGKGAHKKKEGRKARSLKEAGMCIYRLAEGLDSLADLCPCDAAQTSSCEWRKRSTSDGRRRSRPSDLRWRCSRTCCTPTRTKPKR
jgi:hypothetical protein